MDTNKTLEHLNQELVEKSMVSIIFLGVYMVLGLFGNSLVIYVYFWGFKKYSDRRFFIPALAIIDMIACLVNCSSLLSEITMPIIYGHDIACKTERYFSLATTAASVFTLMIIAIDRYLCICRPPGRQIRPQCKKNIIASIVLAAMILSIPYPVFNGVVQIPENGITYRVCMGTPDVAPRVALALSCFYLLSVITVLVIMAVLYFQIIRVVYRQRQFQIQQIQAKRVEQSTTASADENRGDSGRFIQPNRQTPLESRITASSTTHSSPRPVSRSRVTIMFLVITIVFAVSFILRVVVMILDSVSTYYVKDDNVSIFLSVLYTAYIMNNFVNPFIYSCMDKKFQHELRKLFRCEKCRHENMDGIV